MMKKMLVLLVYYELAKCLVHAQSDQFVCEKEGFAVAQSTNCAVYYYCTKSTSSEFYLIKYECPSGEEFSLVEARCVPAEENECGKLPEISIDDPLLSEEFVCPSQGRFPVVDSPDCKSYYSCTTALIATLNTCPGTSVFSWTAMKCSLPDTFICPNSVTTTTAATATTTTATFACTTEGRFPDPEAVDCESYFLCSSTISGSIEPVLSQCPPETVFSPTISNCVAPKDYECPYTTSTASTTEITSEGSIATTSTQGQTEEPETFECTSAGRFPDPFSTDNKSFYICVVGLNGAYVAIRSECPPDHIFSPSDAECVPDATEDPNTSEVTTEEPTGIDTTTTAESSSTSTLVTDAVVTTTEAKEPTLGETTNTQAETSSVSITETTPQYTSSTQDPTVEETTTTIEVTSSPTEPPTNEVFVCTSAGRFADVTSTDCKRYYLCSTNAAGTYEAVISQCPTITIFSAKSNRCVLPTDYQCPFSTPSAPTTLETTASTTIPTTTLTSGFVCTTDGRHPDPSRTGCTTYKYCLLTATNEFLQYTFNCPTATYFDPEQRRCSMNYVCEPADTTTTPESTTQPPSTVTPFVCTSNGRFSDPSSAGCDTYIMCLTTATGAMLRYNFKCPIGSLFSPHLAKCVTDYVCT